MQDYPLNHSGLYKFNTRDIVKVIENVPPKLAQLAGKRGVILYHASYESGVPTAEAVLIGAKVKDALNYHKTGHIAESTGGQIPVIPVQFLQRLNASGAELSSDSILE